MRKDIFTLFRFRMLPVEIHVMLVGSLFARGAYFMVWPFLSVLLYRQFHYSATAIGTLLSAATICGAISGVYTGWLSDRFGRKRLILCGSTLSALAFCVLGYAKEPIVFGIGITGVSIGCVILESSCKALIGDRITDTISRELAFYCRYYAINVGAAIGSLIGMTLGISEHGVTFFTTATIYFIYGVILWELLSRITLANGHVKKNTLQTPGFMTVIKQMVCHRIFTLLLLCNMLAALIYASFDSSLIQYLTRSNISGIMSTIALLVTVNSLTIIVAQFPLLRVLQHHSITVRLMFGIMLMLIAQLLFAFSPLTQFYLLVLATVALSLGELVVFPTFSIAVDKLTPESLRGSYYGAANIYMLGTAFAPIYGGLILDRCNPEVLFLSLSVFCLIIILLQTVINATNRT